MGIGRARCSTVHLLQCKLYVFIIITYSDCFLITVAWGLYYFWYSLHGLVTGELPFAYCRDDWTARYNCCDLQGDTGCFANNQSMTSSEAFFQ